MADTPTIDVIIPHYKETEAQMFGLFSMLASQIGIKYKTLGVILVTDGGGDPVSEKYLDQFRNNISGTTFTQIIRTEDCGPGTMRQDGIDASHADYVFFVDADDCLCTITEMREFQQFVKNQDSFNDIVNSYFIEQIIDPKTGDTVFYRHNPDNTFLHGRFWRRQFLVEGNFRFPKELRHHEDSYYNSLVLACTKDQIMFECATYVWVYNPNSTTKRKSKFGFLMEAIPELIKSTELLVAEYDRRHTPGRDLHVIGAMFYVYYLLQCPFWNNPDPEAAKLREEDEKIFYDFVLKYQDAFERCAHNEVLDLKDTERQIARSSCGFESEIETWDQILRRLNAKYAVPAQAQQDAVPEQAIKDVESGKAKKLSQISSAPTDITELMPPSISASPKK
jgi:hypothetical protein